MAYRRYLIVCCLNELQPTGSADMVFFAIARGIAPFPMPAGPDDLIKEAYRALTRSLER